MKMDAKQVAAAGRSLAKVRQELEHTETDAADVRLRARDVQRIVDLCGALNEKCGLLQAQLRDASRDMAMLRKQLDAIGEVVGSV